jgi:repressor LexA
MVHKTPSEEKVLSPKQASILEYIRAEIADTGRPPTFRDIAKHFGNKAVGTVQDHIRALIDKGFLEKDETVSRGIRLVARSEAFDIPVLGAVPAGNPIEAIHDLQGALAVPNHFAGRALGKSRDALFALRVKGESMIDAGILDGDFVIVRKQNDADHGEIVVAMIDGEATVKTLEKKGGRMRLLPKNPRFAPIEIPPGSESVIQGKVVGLQRFY